MYQFHSGQHIHHLESDYVFVFGSNLAGQHHHGASLTAKQYFGAMHGVARGWSGQSYAIPTEDTHFQAMPISEITYYIDLFKLYCKNHPQQSYFLTAIGCGHTGYRPADIAPLFAGIHDNVIFPESFRPFLVTA